MSKIRSVVVVTAFAIIQCVAHAHEWENPLVNELGKLPARPVAVPCETRESAERIANLEADRASSPYVLSLNGEWDFEWKARPDTNEVRRGTIAVPGCWQLQGDYDPPIYTNVRYPHAKDPPRVMTEPPTNYTSYVYRNPVGTYRRSFEIPSGWSGRRVVLHFGGVYSAFYVRINEHDVGYSEDSRLPAEFDVTPYLRKKSHNRLEVRVLRWCDGSYLEDQDFWRLSGIYRDVWLQAEGADTPHDVIAAANLPPVESAEKWSPANPRLYTRVWQAPNGDWYAWREGYRDIEIKDGVLLLNGERILIKGVNRHELSPTGSYVVTRTEMERDIAVLKKFGFNAVRTCHYPDDPLWYDLCDQAGLLVFSEANIESHDMGFGEASLAKDPLWEKSHVERNVNQVKVLRRHPSIIAWSLGNEAGWGGNFAAACRAVRELDPSRPIQYEGAGHADGFRYWFDVPAPGMSDIASFMYPDLAKIGAWLRAHDGEMPYIMCEYAHAMGNSTGDFAAYWRFAKEYKSFQGGFIWDFADQALVGKDGNLKYGGDYGDSPNDANFNCNGLFDTFRNPHPGAYEVAHVFGAHPDDGYAPAVPDAPGAPRADVAVVLASMRFNLWRAETDNDRGAAMGRKAAVWRKASKSQTLPEGCTTNLVVMPLANGAYRVEFSFTATNSLPDIPRIGLTFTLPGTTGTTVAWRGRGPHENYCDRLDSAPLGDWALSVKDFNDSHYVRPGEVGYRTGASRLTLAGVTFKSDSEGGFGFNVWPWTQEALDKADHDEELPPPDGTLHVNVDAALQGVGGDNSWGARPHGAFLNKAGKTYSLSFTIAPADGRIETVLDAIRRANARFQKLHPIKDEWNGVHSAWESPFWDKATYHIGNLAAARATKNDAALAYSRRWAEGADWCGAKGSDKARWRYDYGHGPEFALFGDWQTCFQVYAELGGDLTRAKEVFDYETTLPQSDFIWWVDGLFMVMPSVTHIALADASRREIYLGRLTEWWAWSKQLMRDEETGFFFRDARFLYPKHKTLNGRKDFWARGNGWAFAALARALDDLEAMGEGECALAKDCRETFRALACAIVDAQNDDGGWSRSILDPGMAPGSETSGTAFFAYGLAWGVRRGVLDEVMARPVLERAWSWLVGTALQPDGAVGFVQPVGDRADPRQKLSPRSEAEFGVGAFLLAASEYLKLLEM